VYSQPMEEEKSPQVIAKNDQMQGLDSQLVQQDVEKIDDSQSKNDDLGEISILKQAKKFL
jgi:hypothetical protein